jgi:hypothetical protein
MFSNKSSLETSLGCSRREFLKSTVVLSTGVAMGPFARAATSAGPDWVDRPMRWAQLTLVEDDPAKFDIGFWLDYFKRTHSDAVCLSAGGCVAYYPTKVPLHHRSKWLGNRDVFGELVRGCRKLGMVVIARTDPHATYDDAKEAHPDWIATDADGKPRRHWASPEMWVTCGLGPYNFQFMTEVKKEIMSRYKVDGIFINRWDGSGMCYCEHCQRSFKITSGLALPRSDAAAEVRRAHLQWRQDRLFELWRLWDSEVRRINSRSCVIPNTGGGALSGLDMDKIGHAAETLMADRQARRGLAPPWLNGKNGKEYRSTMGRKPIVGIFSVGLEEPYRWKDSVQNEAEIRIWVAEGTANGLRPWFTKFGGVIHDPRWLRVVEDIYSWHHRAEKYLRNEAPLARVGLVYSQQTAWHYGGERAREKLEDHALGLYQALIEARIPFEMVHDRRLSREALGGFKTLLLPNIAALSDKQCEELRDFVHGGGGLVATHETSLYDENGKRRDDFGLADLFGAHFDGRVEGPMRNSYLRLEKERNGTRHEILKGLEDAPRIINGVWRVVTKPATELASRPLTLIPSYPDLPMEKVYPRVPQTDSPEVYVRHVRSGRMVYFPWDIDRAFWEVLCVDHGKLLRNAVNWATNEEPPVTVEGPGFLDVTVWRQENSMTVHLVNLTNPMTMKGPFRDLFPIGQQTVHLHLPERLRVRGVRLLKMERAARWRERAGLLSVTVPSVLDHEVVAIDVV